MENKLQLYFMAILPPPEISREIKAFKEEFHAKFNNPHAVKVPPHITVQKPFKRMSEEAEEQMLAPLDHFSKKMHPISVELKDFKRFDKRVIFIEVLPNPLLIELRKELRKILKSKLDFKHKQFDERPFHPHITIATRNVDKVFKTAWPLFENRQYSASFEVNRIYLMKHVEGKWVVVG